MLEWWQFQVPENSVSGVRMSRSRLRHGRPGRHHRPWTTPSRFATSVNSWKLARFLQGSQSASLHRTALSPSARPRVSGAILERQIRVIVPLKHVEFASRTISPMNISIPACEQTFTVLLS